MRSRKESENWRWLSLSTIILLIVVGIAPQFFPMTTGGQLLLPGSAIVGCAIIGWLHYKKKVYWLIETTVISAVIASLLLIHTGLTPLAQIRSAKTVVQPLPQKEAIVALYGEYATSAVFYSGYLIPQLVHMRDADQQNVWSGKYTMPIEIIGEFEQKTLHHPNTYILVKNAQNQFKTEPLSQNFIEVAQYANMTLYRKVFTP